MKTVLEYGCLAALMLLASPGCTPKKKKLTPAQRCHKGCEFRMQCIEEMALEKAVTDANREHVRRAQQKDHKRYVDFCAKACVAGEARFKAFAQCGVEAKNCESYFACESSAAKRHAPPRVRARPTP